MDVVALGELLIDFTENGISSQGNPLFEANPGGAPCNVLAMLTKLGHKTAFIGKVGNDFFGKQLEQTIMEVGIDASGLQKDDDVHTTLALVHTYPDGDRDFSFYRNPGADMMLTEEEVPEELIKGTRIFHFGTLSMTHEGVRNATKKALRAAKEAGAVISFDPNLREPLWNSLDEAKEQVLYGLGQCDILKISDNEIQWLTGEEDFTKGVHWILERYHIPLILVSMGREGSRAYYKDLIESGVKIYEYMPGFIHGKVFVSDDIKAVVGTINLDFRSLYLHFECATFIYKNDIIKKISEDFKETLNTCKLVSLNDCKNTNLLYKIGGSILRIFAPLL